MPTVSTSTSSTTRTMAGFAMVWIFTLALFGGAQVALQALQDLAPVPTPASVVLIVAASALLAAAVLRQARQQPTRSLGDAALHGVSIAAVIVVVDAVFGMGSGGLVGALRALMPLVGIPLVEVVAQRVTRPG